MRISDWSSDVCSSDLRHRDRPGARPYGPAAGTSAPISLVCTLAALAETAAGIERLLAKRVGCAAQCRCTDVAGWPDYGGAGRPLLRLAPVRVFHGECVLCLGPARFRSGCRSVAARR